MTELTNAQKRVQIAMDVIEHMNAERIISRPGVYIDLISVVPEGLIVKRDTQVKEVFDKLPSCDVCALGACFVSMMRRYNECTVEEMLPPKYGGYDLDIDDAYDFLKAASRSMESQKEYLSRLFDEEQLCLIEVAYEGINSAGSTETWDTGEDAKPINQAILDAHEFHMSRVEYTYTPSLEYVVDGVCIDVEVGERGTRETNLTGSEVLKDIMKNIIRNKGEFKP